MGFVKIGFFRIVRGDEETYLSYDELRSWDEDARKRALDGIRRGDAHAFCACRAGNDNPLTVTSLGHVRVAVNGRQGDHADSCPKSASYAGWAEQAKKGLAPLEALEEGDGGRLCFNFSIPNPGPSSGSSSSSGTGTGKPREKKIPLCDLVTCVNRIAWLKQTYSVKKKIAEAHREGRDPDWNYKNLEEFNRLYFGVCNDVYVRVRGVAEPLSHYAYRKKDFLASTKREDRFFIYAPILKVKEVNHGRKYQYVTVAMPGPASEKKTAVRIPTDDYLALFGEFAGGEEESLERGARILAGFVEKTSFKKDDGSGYDVWVTLVKGCVINVTENGLWYENDEAGEVIRELCRRRVVFRRPYLPLENFGSEVPTIVIDRYKAKNLIIDCPDPSVAEVHAGYAKDNEEFDVVIAREGDDAAAVVSKAVPQRRQRKENES